LTHSTPRALERATSKFDALERATSKLHALARATSLAGAAAAALALPGPALAAGAIRAAYVEAVIPGRPFSAVFQPNAGLASTGPSSGVLGVTSLSITSFGTAQVATMVLKVMSLPDGVNCGGAGTGASLV
jgi:hypothetical protein